MKIIYNENPLRSVVELDEKDKEILLLRIKIEQLEEAVFSAHYDLEKGDVEEAKKDLNPDFYEGEAAYSYAKTLHAYLIDALSESHAGDCTCFPASCVKCHAEEIMGIRTTNGLGKHQGAKIYALFQKEGMTLDRAIAELEAYQKPIKDGVWDRTSQEDFDVYCVRWAKEAEQAAEWLKAYREEHFKDNVCI